MVTQLLSLPGAITIPRGYVQDWDGKKRYEKDLYFELKIFKNGMQELRLCYELTYPRNMTWYNRFDKYWCDWLILIENIGSDRLLREAITDTRHFLISNKLS